MNLIAIFGAGLLVGAAIIIILPEGMLVLFESMISPEIVSELGLDGQHQNELTNTSGMGNTTILKQRTILAEADPHGHSSVFDPNVIKYAGLSLIFGFSLMLVLDQGFLIIKEH